MRIRVLGCSGAEFPGYNPTGFLLDNEILLDAGSLTNVLDEKAQLKIKNIFVTHAHLDHIKGIPFLADNIIIGNWRHRVNIFSIPPVIKTIKKHLLNSSVWPDLTVIPNPRNAVLNLKTVEVGQSMETDGYTITPYSVNHAVPAVGYLIEDRKKRRFFYTGDTGPFDTVWEKIGEKQLHCLIIEVSFPNKMGRMALITGHLTPNLLKEELSKISIPPKKIYITHPKPQYLNTIRAELEGLDMNNLRLLKDGETITV